VASRGGRHEIGFTQYAAGAVAAVGLAGGFSAPPAKAEDVVLKMAVPDWPPTHIMKT